MLLKQMLKKTINFGCTYRTYNNLPKMVGYLKLPFTDTSPRQRLYSLEAKQGIHPRPSTFLVYF